jgi:hypothetical protein
MVLLVPQKCTRWTSNRKSPYAVNYPKQGLPDVRLYGTWPGRRQSHEDTGAFPPATVGAWMRKSAQPMEMLEESRGARRRSTRWFGGTSARELNRWGAYDGATARRREDADLERVCVLGGAEVGVASDPIADAPSTRRCCERFSSVL